MQDEVGGLIEGVVAIDEGFDFATFCCSCKQGVGEGGTSSGRPAEDLEAGFDPGLEGGKGPYQGVFIRHLFACLIVACGGEGVKGERWWMPVLGNRVQSCV